MSYVCVGKLLKPHGVRGSIQVQSYTDPPEALLRFSAFCDQRGAPLFEVELTGHKLRNDILCVRLPGVLNRDDASQLSNTSLFVSRSVFEPLEDGTFYVADLIGLSVHSEKGQFFGTVCAVHDFGSGPVLEIQMSGSPLQQKRESGEECTSRSEDSPKNKSALRKTFYLPFDNNVHLQEAPERNLVVSEALYAVFTT